VLRGLCTLLMAAPVALAACGGGDEPSRDDLRTIRGVLTSSAAVQRAVAPLYECLPGDADCYRAAGPGIIEAVAREQASFGGVLQEVDNECLTEVGRLYDDSLDVYGEAGRAAAAGQTAVADRAISRSAQVEIAYIRKLDECGFSEGKTAKVGAEMRRINIRVIQLVEELTACKSEKCVLGAARELGVAGQDGSKAVDALLAELPGDAPACIREGLSLMKQSFDSLERTAAAIEQGKFETAQREGTRSDGLRAQAQEQIAACLTTALGTG
jgi:hypothetical protein